MESSVNDTTIGEISRKAVTTTSFEWKIRHVSKLPKKANVYLKSPMFSFLDAEWRIVLKLGKIDRDVHQWITLYLIKDHSISNSHFVSYRLSIIKEDGTEYETFSRLDLFEGKKAPWALCMMKKYPFLETSEIAPQDAVTMICTLHSHICANNEVASQTMYLDGIDKLARDFKNFFNRDKDTDVSLKLKNKEFRAHKNVLRARSSVFDAMFEHNWSDKKSGVVDIPDCDPEAFQYFLKYLYSASDENLSNEIVLNLYSIADKYDVEDLKQTCVKFMARNLSVDTFCNVVALALQHKESALMETATDFFLKNAKEVTVTVQWQSFLKKNPEAANELYRSSIL